jgi:hypothetical protein
LQQRKPISYYRNIGPWESLVPRQWAQGLAQKPPFKDDGKRVAVSAGVLVVAANGRLTAFW